MKQPTCRIFVEGPTDVKFLKDLICTYFDQEPDDALFVQTKGHGFLFSESNLNQLQRAQDEGITSLVIFDADSNYLAREKELRSKATLHRIAIKLYLFPTNRDAGDRESLLQMIANPKKYRPFSNCFEPYMTCLQAYKVEHDADSTDTIKLDVPNRKVAIHNYLKIHCQEAKERKRDYTDSNYWDIRSEYLDTLVNFLKPYFS